MQCACVWLGIGRKLHGTSRWDGPVHMSRTFLFARNLLGNLVLLVGESGVVGRNLSGNLVGIYRVVGKNLPGHWQEKSVPKR